MNNHQTLEYNNDTIRLIGVARVLFDTKTKQVMQDGKPQEQAPQKNLGAQDGGPHDDILQSTAMNTVQCTHATQGATILGCFCV